VEPDVHVESTSGKLILVVSATQEQAVTLLGHVKEQFKRNTLLMDRPSASMPHGRRAGHRPPAQALAGQSHSARQRLDDLRLRRRSGPARRRNGTERPGLIVVDDLENQEHVIFEEQSMKFRDWFDRTLLHAGHTETNVVVVGTILHHDSLLANLINPTTSPGWERDRHQAVEQIASRTDLWERWSAIFNGLEEFEERAGVDAAEAYFKSNKEAMLQDARVLWPQWESYYDLMVMREREGRAAFQAEKQNEPLDPDQCVFADASIRYWHDEFPDEQSLVEGLTNTGEFYGACDPSLGIRTGKGDYTAIVILCRERKTGMKFVIAADIARRSPNQTIERILKYATMYHFDNFGVETNHFQSVMVDNLEQRAKIVGVRLRLERIESRSNKQSRIANLEPEVAQGRIKFRRRDQLRLDQLRSFPLGAYDDGPDALEMAVHVADKCRNRLRRISI